MNATKPAKTLADYMVIAVSPVLIMVMVHSLCFFLVEVFYHGEAIGAVRWVLFWFVLAVVLIARIGIEEGDGRAMVYGIALAAVTWLYLSWIQTNAVFGAFLLGVVWFTAHHLTCNCTLIDDDADASGQGLLQTLWGLPQKFKRSKAPVMPPVLPDPPAGPAESRKGILPGRGGKPRKRSKHQIPGVWLIYYSLAALPLFGFGQILLPAGDIAARRQGFVYLFLYLAAALGLLVATSFLGLRRYLRQRNVAMPVNIALGWVQFGVVGAFIVLCLTLLIPRPGGGAAWESLRYHVDYQLHRASEFAARFNPHGTGSGRAGNETANGNHPLNNQNTPASTSNQGPSAGANGQGDRKPGHGNAQRPMPPATPTGRTIYPLLKMLFWLVVAAFCLWFLFRYSAVIWMAVRTAWAALLNFLRSLFSRVRSAAQIPQRMPKTGVPPFRAFKNPFLSGGAQIWPPEKLIVYSYEALQSWAMDQEAKHNLPQTPREFCRTLGQEMPDAAEALAHLAFLYGHVAYGTAVPGNYHPEQLRLLWEHMARPRNFFADLEGSRKDARPQNV